MSFSETEHPQDRHRPGSLSSLQLSRRIADYGRLLHLNRELPGNAVYDLGTGRHSAWELWLILAAFTAVQNNRLLVLRNLNPQFRVFPRRIGPVNQPRNHRCRDYPPDSLSLSPGVQGSLVEESHDYQRRCLLSTIA